MKNKRSILLSLLLIAALMLAACGGGGAEEPVEEEPMEEGSTVPPAESMETFRVAIIMPSSTTDIAWSQSIYDALVAVQTDMGGEEAMEIAYSENMFQVTDAAAAIRDYAADGYDLVIAHGTQYGNSMFEVATDFPETSFAWGTATDVGEDEGYENIFAYEANAQEGGYVNGVIAGMLTESGVIGVVGPVEAGDAKLYIDGFVAGVTAANADAEVNISYTGSFGDTALASEAANTHIQAGADVLTGSAQQVVGAIGVAAENGVPWLGTQSDQSSLAPEYVIANQIYDWTGVLSDMIGQIQSGTLGGTAYVLTLGDGLVIEFNDGYEISEEIVSAAEETEAGIESGDIEVMSGE